MKQLIILFFVGISSNLFGQIDGENLFDDSFLHEIRFSTVDTNHYISTKEYQMVNMQIDNNDVADIGFKRKGNTSGYPSTNKFPIKIKTNKYIQGQEYDGIKEFMLHMNYQDPTMLREKLTYDICAEMGLYSLRTSFAKVYINDIYWGLYTIIEGKDEMYKHVFDNRDADAMESAEFGGMCYAGAEIEDYFFDQGPGFYVYENDNGDFNSAWSKFITMLDKINNTPNTVYVDTVSNYFNLRDFFRYQATNVYLLNMDSYIWFTGNQRYVHDTIQNIWQVTPWDFNASFGLWNTNNVTVTDYPMLPTFSCFGEKINDIPELKTYYLDAMCELTNTVCDTTQMYARIDELKMQIQDAVYTDTRKVVSNQNFDDGLEFGYYPLFSEDQPALKTVLRERFNLIKGALANESYNCSSITSSESIEEKKNHVNIYPNPSSQIIHVESELLTNQDFSLEVINAFGQNMAFDFSGNTSLDISNLDNGIYFLIITVGSQRIVQRFIKQ